LKGGKQEKNAQGREPIKGQSLVAGLAKTKKSVGGNNKTREASERIRSASEVPKARVGAKVGAPTPR